MEKLQRVVIIGMGLIGGSIGKALISKGLAEEVVGVCRRQSSLDRAIKEKSLTLGFVNSYEEACKGADVIFIATPVHTIKKVLDDLAVSIKEKGVIVTDAGSTKKEIVEYAEKYSDVFSFVGGHPLAGSEKAGVEYSREDLYEGSLCLLTRGESTAEEDMKKIEKIWRSLGAEVEILSPEEHDRILSFTSHLPHIAAYALAGVQKEKYLKYVSTGFKDTTRIALSDPGLWSDIFLSNRASVLSSIARFKELLSGIEDDIRENREDALKEKLTLFKKVRDGII